MIIDKLVYDIREALKDFSDDSELSNRYLEFLIAVKRAKLLRQELDKFGRPFNNSVLQSLCLPITKISSDECSVATTCNNIARTVKPIPNTLQLTTRDSINRVSPSDITKSPFDMIKKNMVPYIESTMFNKKIKVFLDDNDYIYLLSPDNTFFFDCLSIQGVFEDPLELAEYNKCCDCQDPQIAFDRDVDDYPLPPHLIDAVRKDIINELAKELAIPQDKENDQQDER